MESSTPVSYTHLGLRVTKKPGEVKVVDTVGAGDSFMGGMIDAMWGMGPVSYTHLDVYKRQAKW